MCQILNSMHIVNFSLILEIFSIICKHQSDEMVNKIVLAFIDMKKALLWQFPLEPFIELL